MLRLSSFITLAIATLASASPLLQTRAAMEVIPNQYIVTFKSDASNLAPRNVTSLVDEIVAELSTGLARRDGAAPHILQRYDFGQGSYQGFAIDVQADAIEQLKQHPEVDEVFNNYVHKLEPVKVISEQPYQGLTKRALPAGLWGLDAIDGSVDGSFVPPANGGQNVDVYVIDTGVDGAHSEFAGNRVIYGPSYAGAREPALHGTHVAGTIGGKTFGIARRSTIISVQVFTAADGSSSTDIILAGVNWAAQSAKSRGRLAVANLSLGAGGRISAMENAVLALINAGVSTALAAGNDRIDACTVSPAALRDAVTVAASAVNYQFATSFSNKGACVDIIAPGQGILSASPNNKQATISGTSMAAPHVAGALALERSARPSANARAAQDSVINRGQRNRIKSVPAQTPNNFLYLG
ncbi:peptidase S8/S53 domain-containing protein [Phlyctochytrium arcticum]|nr:peptidase S8/S53 domain-containing protein [Phlyctochytrium arcticum]